MRVKVYFNLHRKCFSVMHKGRVASHLNNVLLSNVEFKVSEAGRQRVLKDKRKNVHAFVVGDIVVGHIRKGIEIKYDPYRFKTFVTEIEQKPVRSAKLVMLSLTREKRSKIIALDIE